LVRRPFAAANDLSLLANKEPHLPGRLRSSTPIPPSTGHRSRESREGWSSLRPTCFRRCNSRSGARNTERFQLTVQTYKWWPTDCQYRRKPAVTSRAQSFALFPGNCRTHCGTDDDNTIPYRVPRYELFPAARCKGRCSGCRFLDRSLLWRACPPVFPRLGFECTDSLLSGAATRNAHAPCLRRSRFSSCFLGLVAAITKVGSCPMAIVLIVPIALASLPGL